MNMTTRRYTVSKISTASLAKFGCVLGGLALFLPGLVCALVSVQLVTVLREMLDRWQSSEIDLIGLGVPVEFDFIALLGLETAQTLLTRLDDNRLVLGLLVLLVGVIAGGALVAVVILLLGWGYNLLAAVSGGLDVELRE
jgi:hypothetical protein